MDFNFDSLQRRSPMNEIRGSHVLVTGGAGFIGSTIVDQLLGAGAAEVRILDSFVRGSWTNVARALARGGVVVTQGDIRDTKLVDKVTAGVDYVFHQAAL